MNKLLIIFTALILSLSSCSKENLSPSHDPGERPGPAASTPSLPSTFTQKVLVEMYSSAICGTSPDAMLKYEAYAAQYPTRVFGADVHNYDAMQLPLWNTLDTMMNLFAFSTASFNRMPYNGIPVIAKTAWQSSNMLNTALNQTATCGLKISSSIAGNQATVNVDAGFNAALSGDYRLTVYLIEDSVTGTASGYNQSNYYNTTASSPFYQMGNPMLNYKHQCVVRKVLTANKGTELTSNGNITAKSLISKSFTTTLAGNYNPSRMYVIAFINHIGTSMADMNVLNVQRVKLGYTCNWN